MALWQTAGEYGGSNSFWTAVGNALHTAVAFATENWVLVAGVAVGLVVIGAFVLRGRRG